MVIKCPSWGDLGLDFGGSCSEGLCNSKPSYGYCVDICKKCSNNHKELTKYLLKRAPQMSRPTKSKKPTTTQMAIHFAKAMTKWIRAGVPVCSKEDYIKRRKKCAECHDGKSCPVCGCQLWAKTALETEKCPNGLW